MQPSIDVTDSFIRLVNMNQQRICYCDLRMLDLPIYIKLLIIPEIQFTQGDMIIEQ